MKNQLRILGAAMVMAVLSAAGCGGGSSSGGSVSPPPPPPPPPSGGIIRTGVALGIGPVTGFGSVIVNGVTYNTDSATFTRDGLAATQDDFSVGEVVYIRGTIDDNNANAVAEAVEFDDNVEGPLTEIVDATTIVVMGQTVRLTGTTSIDNNCPALLDDPTIVAIEVSGTVDANGVIEATRIDCKFSMVEVGQFEVKGVVSGHSAANMTFMINGLQVDYSAAAVDNFPVSGVINDGDPVEAKGTEFDDGVNPPVLTATRVEYKGARFAENEGDHIEIEGFITRFASPTDFDVSGIPATEIPGTTVYRGGSSTNLGLNLKIEAEGEFDADGVLNATRIEIKTSTNVRVTGQVDSVSGNVITILGIAVNTDPQTTRFEDKSSARVDPLHVGDINTNDYVEARGQELPAGEITAFLVERDDFDPTGSLTALRGFVETGGANRPTLTVLGVSIDTSEAVFRNANRDTITADDFWAAVSAGSLINAKGTETNTTALTASEVELEME